MVVRATGSSVLKHQFAILAGLALVLTSAASQAEPVRSGAQVLNVVRAAGFSPIGTAARDGEQFVVRAIDRRGADVQIFVDAQDGDILYVRRLGGLARGDFAGPRVVQGSPRYPDFFGNVPRPPRTVPGTRAAPPSIRSAAAGTPVPRPRPDDITGSVNAEAPASPPAAAKPPAAPAKGEVPPVVGFE
jgi:hypothetical protein